MPYRCDWAADEYLKKYHDSEWGVPLHDDKKLFEFLILDGAQAGLSWSLILRKRPAYKRAFHNFNPSKVAGFNASDMKKLGKNSGIIRNSLKIKSAVNNARRFLEVVDEFGSFDRYIWGFVKNETIIHKYKKWKEIPSHTAESAKMSDDLKKRGFTFVGPTICYAFMQSAGMVNDHVISCFRHKQVM